MILIADSGSTKTDWCVLQGGKSLMTFQTKGMNPFFQTTEERIDMLRQEVLPRLPQADVEAIYFYGAGCTPEKCMEVRSSLQQCIGQEGASLPTDRRVVEVNSDMLGAARALCGQQKGIACILGTGSNSCLYDGIQIQANVSPLGFILGDEGSGAVLGKLLVGSLLKGQLTAGLKEEFLHRYNLTPADIIERVYRRPFPNRFLASLSPFLAAHLDDPSIRRLVLDAFTAFIQRNVMQYDDYTTLPVHFCGSIAFYYRALLAEAVERQGLTLGHIVQSPLSGLVTYHTASIPLGKP